MSSAAATVAEVQSVGDAEKYAVGKIYKVNLSTGMELMGIVLAYDSDYNIVIFQDDTKPRSGNSMTTRLVNANFISKLTYIRKCKNPLATKKRSVDLDGLLAKEKLAIREMEGTGVSVGVTEEAKSIFEALAKTLCQSRLSVQWENSDILVEEQVRVCSPYRPDCVTGGTKTVKNRVKKVLEELERKNLQLSGN